jgi:hypothetical protein
MNNFSEAQFTKRGANVFVLYPHFNYGLPRGERVVMKEHDEFSEQYNTSTDNLKANLRTRFNAKFGPGSFVKYMRSKKPASNNNGMNVNNAPRISGRKRKTVNTSNSGTNFEGWSSGGTASIWVKNANGKSVKDARLKNAYLESKGITRAPRATKGNAQVKTATGPVAASNAARYNMDIGELRKAMDKFHKGVQVVPGMARNNRTLNIFQAVLNAQLRHFSDPAVRQSYSGGILETTSFAVAAKAAGLNAWYFNDPPLSKDITKVRGLGHGFILKTAFSLDNTIKNPNVETNKGLFKIWKKIVGLAATPASRTHPDMRKWLENTKSPFKGFFEVQPDVLEWIPEGANCPNGVIRIYEMKVGIGKPEAAPAEAYQLLKAKRAIELLFIGKGFNPPCIELYFLPWMYGTPEGASGKFTNYINNHRFGGKNIWKNLTELRVANGYRVKELTIKSFAELTKLNTTIMTTILDVFRKQQANNLASLLAHAKRHRLGLRGVTAEARQATLGVLKNFPNRKGEANVIERQLKSLLPRNKIPPGMNKLAALIAHPELVGGNTRKERGNIGTRALQMLGWRKGSKYMIVNKQGQIENNPGGVSENNKYFSNNNNNNNKLNRRNLQRVTAARSKLPTLAPMAAQTINGYSIYTKTGVPVPGASRENARILAKVLANKNDFGSAYGQFIRNLSALPENRRRALANNLKSQMNKLAAENPAAYANKRNYIKARTA